MLTVTPRVAPKMINKVTEPHNNLLTILRIGKLKWYGQGISPERERRVEEEKQTKEGIERQH